MRKSGFFISTALFLGLGFSASAQITVQPKKQEIMMKIGNVKVLKDEEGVTNSCEFDVTVYNRSEADLESAAVDLRWVDQTMVDVLKEEKTQLEADKAREAREAKEKEAREAKEGKKANTAGLRPRSERGNRSKDIEKEQDDGLDALEVSIEVPAIKSYEQVIIRSQVKTDKCFLLISEAELKTKSCTANTKQENNAPERPTLVSAKGKSGGCTASFALISAKDPQYYKEFKKLTLEEQRLLELTQFEKNKQELEIEYQKTISAINEASTVINSIK